MSVTVKFYPVVSKISFLMDLFKLGSEHGPHSRCVLSRSRTPRENFRPHGKVGTNQPEATLKIPDTLGSSECRLSVLSCSSIRGRGTVASGQDGKGRGRRTRKVPCNSLSALSPVQTPPVRSAILPDLVPGSCLLLCLITVQRSNHYAYH